MPAMMETDWWSAANQARNASAAFRQLRGNAEARQAGPTVSLGLGIRWFKALLPSLPSPDSANRAAASIRYG